MRKGIIFFYAIAFCVAGCQVDEKNRISTERGTATADILLEERNGVFFEPGSKEPFNGTVVFHLENGTKYSESVIEEGLRVSGIIYNNDGSVKERNVIEYQGTEPAISTTYYASGSKKRQYEMIPSEETGIFHMREWYENGQLKSEVPMNRDGEYHGTITIWDQEGNVMKQESYENGILIEE